MALTKAERETLAKLTDKAKAEEEETNGYEIWVKKGDHEVKLTGAKAKAFAKKFGIEDDDQDETEEEETEEELPDDEPPAAAGGYWKGRK